MKLQNLLWSDWTPKLQVSSYSLQFNTICLIYFFFSQSSATRGSTLTITSLERCANLRRGPSLRPSTFLSTCLRCQARVQTTCCGSAAWRASPCSECSDNTNAAGENTRVFTIFYKVKFPAVADELFSFCSQDGQEIHLHCITVTASGKPA